MKKLFKLALVCAVAMAAITLTSCGGDSPFGNGVDDPAGTIPLSVRNGSNGSTSVPVGSGSGFSFYIDKGDNFVGSYFASVGKVSGLGAIRSIPDVGWSPIVAVTPGHGYVAVFYRGSEIIYTRIYVEGYIEGAGSGGVIGADIKYQYPFNGKAKSIDLPDRVSLPFKLRDYAYYSNYSPRYYNQYGTTTPVSMNKVSAKSDGGGSFSFENGSQNIYFDLRVYDDNPVETATVVLTSEGLPQKEVTLTIEK